MTSASAKDTHTISFNPDGVGNFDVLINGFSYAVNRNLTRQRALERAADIKRSFTSIGERSSIQMDEAVACARETQTRERSAICTAGGDRPGHRLSM